MTSEDTAEKDRTHAPLSMEQIEVFVEEVIEANAIWPDPLPSQVSSVMDVVREAMAQAWDEGANAAVEAVNTGTRMTLRARIPFPANENPYWTEKSDA